MSVILFCLRLLLVLAIVSGVVLLFMVASRKEQRWKVLRWMPAMALAVLVLICIVFKMSIILAVVLFTLVFLALLFLFFEVLHAAALLLSLVILAGLVLYGLFNLPVTASASSERGSSSASASNSSSSAVSSSALDSSSTEASATASSPPEPPLNSGQQTQVKSQVEAIAPDYPANKIIVTYTPDWSRHTEQRGTTWFCNFTSHTPADVAKCLNGASDRSRAARQQFIAAVRGDKTIRQAGTADAEIQRGLSGNGWIAVQFLDAAQVTGNGYFKDGKYWVANGKWFKIKAGDVFWLFVARDGHVVWAAVQRADCHNGGLQGIRPVTSTTPSAPPVGTPSSSATPAPHSTQSRSTTPARPTPTTIPTSTPTPTGKHSSQSPTPTGGPVSSGTTSVSHPSPTSSSSPQTTDSSTPTEVQNPSPTSSSPPVSGDPGGA